jgi:carboxylesterase type B
MDEDCLYLNIFVPQSALPTEGSAAMELLPIMLWLHAGEFSYGTSEDRESEWPSFMNGSAILVTTNSRLGIAGYGVRTALRIGGGGRRNENARMIRQKRSKIEVITQQGF